MLCIIQHWGKLRKNVYALKLGMFSSIMFISHCIYSLLLNIIFPKLFFLMELLLLLEDKAFWYEMFKGCLIFRSHACSLNCLTWPSIILIWFLSVSNFPMLFWHSIDIFNTLIIFFAWLIAKDECICVFSMVFLLEFEISWRDSEYLFLILQPLNLYSADLTFIVSQTQIWSRRKLCSNAFISISGIPCHF